MINYKKINEALDKSVDLINTFAELNREELIYLKAVVETKINLDETSKL